VRYETRKYVRSGRKGVLRSEAGGVRVVVRYERGGGV
jgi:hypothetical protein